jgi:uncharacterized membrane protein
MRSLLVLLLLASTAFAEGLPSLELDEQIDTARVQRTAGAVLALSGVAMALAATIMGSVYVHEGPEAFCFSNDPDCISRQNLAVAATGMAVTSSVLMSVGIPLWAVGADRVKKLERRARVSGFFSQNGGGAAVRVSF